MIADSWILTFVRFLRYNSRTHMGHGAIRYEVPHDTSMQRLFARAGLDTCDTAGLLRWEVGRAPAIKMHWVWRVVGAGSPPEPPATKKRLGGLRPPHPHLVSLLAVSQVRARPL